MGSAAPALGIPEVSQHELVQNLPGPLWEAIGFHCAHCNPPAAGLWICRGCGRRLCDEHATASKCPERRAEYPHSYDCGALPDGGCTCQPAPTPKE